MPDAVTDLSPLRRMRREKILDAAQTCFVEFGFRSTSMEAIADTAQTSKATLYKYFRDKDAAFNAVAARLANRLLEAVQTELNAHPKVEDAITNALVVKHEIVWDVVRNSPHASELFLTKSAMAQSAFTDLDAAIIEAISMRLSGTGNRPNQELARLLFWAVNGVANALDEKCDLVISVRSLVEPLLANHAISKA